MHDGSEENMLMLRCPCCQQRFKVQPTLMERQVECKVCDWSFRVTEDVLVRSKKFYPGEARLPGKERFNRIQKPPKNLQPSQAMARMYAAASPQRVLAGLLGAIFMVIVALLLVFGTGFGGPLEGIDLPKRFVIAGFGAAIGFFLLVYANRARRRRVCIIAGACAAGLIALPAVFFPKVKQSTVVVVDVVKLPDEVLPQETLGPEERRMKEISERMRLDPLNREIERMRENGGSMHAYGVFFVGLRDTNRIAVRDYMFRVASPDPSSHIYPRDAAGYLMVLGGIKGSIEEVAALAAPLGKVREIIHELSVIEIVVDNSIFEGIDNGKLSTRGTPEFYELNLKELGSIDIRRVESAVIRLTDAEPAMYRADITRKLRELWNSSGVHFHAAITRALILWDEDVEGLTALANANAAKLHAAKIDVPVEMVALAVKNPTPEIVPVLMANWRISTLSWENLCIEAGAILEKPMLLEFAESRGSHRQSAARILSRIGGAESKAALEAAMNDENREMALVIRQALDTLVSRMEREVP
jgi:hypothetical protein